MRLKSDLEQRVFYTLEDLKPHHSYNFVKMYLLKLQKAGKKRPECFLPSSKEEVQPSIINCETPSGR
jgi:hypothetical protein